jgi:hypothetical protein
MVAGEVVTDLGEAVLVVMDLAAEVLVVVLLAAAVLAAMVSADPLQVGAWVASDRGRGERVDLRTEGFLVAQTAVASVIAVSAIVDSAILIGAFSILASLASDTHITIHMTTRITIHMIIPITIQIRATAPVPI